MNPDGKKWKDVLTDASVVAWTLSEENANDPALMLADLLAQARREALDPAISQDAANLVAAARQEAFALGVGMAADKVRRSALMSSRANAEQLASEIRALRLPEGAA